MSDGTPAFLIELTLRTPSVEMVEVVESQLVEVMSSAEAASAFLGIQAPPRPAPPK